MGQRTFRSQFTDKMIQEYLPEAKESCKIKKYQNPVYSSSKSSLNNLSDSLSNNAETEELIDLTYEFDLGNPVSKVNIEEVEKLRKGILNHYMSGKKRINKLILILKTSLSCKETYQNYNLHLLFGIYLLKDINEIRVSIVDQNGNLTDCRQLINNLMEFIVFKSNSLVVVNDKFIYHYHPGFKNMFLIMNHHQLSKPKHSLLVKNEETKQNDDEMFVSGLLQDFFFHSYMNISAAFSNLHQLKLLINKTYSGRAQNVILPKIEILNLNNELGTLLSFLNYLSSKFSYVSIEFKIEKDSCIEMLEQLKEKLKDFEYLVISFDFSQVQDLNKSFSSKKADNSIIGPENSQFLEDAQKFLEINKLTQVTIAEHISEVIPSKQPNLVSDQINIYHYVYYNRKLQEEVTTILKAISKSKSTKRLKNKKPIINSLLEFNFGHNYHHGFYVRGVCDYSLKTVKNRKVVTY